MKTLNMKKAAIGLTILSTVAALTACGGNSTDTGSSATSTAAATAAATDKPAEKVTLTFFTNNSDRTAGQGKIEQELIDQYTKEHPNVEIKVETLSPDPQYQDKIKVYNASNNLPDIISSWGNSSFLGPLLSNNSLAEIDRDSLKDAGFIPAALDGFSANGKLYGFPRNSDFFVLYYNKKIFADNGIQVPKTTADLKAAIDKLKANKIVPIAMDGQDPWPSGIWFDTLVQRASGTWDVSHKAMDRSGSFKDPAVVTAATEMQNWIKAGAFGDGFLNNDYGAARNMFGQGKAAMYMMGEWEMGIATDANFPDEVKNNIGAFSFPTIDGGKGTTDDLTAWFGGGYSVSNNSKHKKEAIDFLTWMFRPDGWAKSVWQAGVTFPAQKYDQFQTGKETPVQKDLTTIFNTAKSYSGTVNQDKFTPDTLKTYYDTIQKLESDKINPQDFSNSIDDTADKSSKATAK
ncbi:extracellular solute-binding protein [Paenibacillus athensensis]|uniref:ABC transporter substrate-binding protein n=1 Tax=Paenibacillus athensensis TaxID=1967502 RepID=A0A4Y8Q1K2_9BACL|nr:extracellular solute-binding protein [Paenibacillus athensensis]MCD1261160.1 extracellular solute-binding protein [Paenibacillus athensensis]